MKILRIDPADLDRAAIRRAATVIRRGGLVAFPTETVYGLGANALDPNAVERIYSAKGRPHYNPLIAHVASAEAARRRVREWPDTAERLAHVFWPGPLTLVLRRDPSVPDVVSAGRDTLAVRVPDHPVALALLAAAEVPIVAPSANPSMGVSPTLAEHVERGLGGAVDLILDAGPTGVGIESTVVDLTGDRMRVLRPGALTTAELEAAVGASVDPPAEEEDSSNSTRAAEGVTARPSPGMLDRHYAPRGRVELFEAGAAGAAADRVRSAADSGATVGALLREVTLPETGRLARVERLPDDPAGYARGLYAALHRLDEAGCDLILAEAVPPEEVWSGVRDRLRRAATAPDTGTG